MQHRDGFTSSIGVTLATLGSAVGLGNIWKFPYMTGMNGGASFLLVYILCTFLVGLPVMISEILIGRHVKANAITCYKSLSPKGQPWFLIGVAGVVSAFLIMAFYTEVAGWVFAYIFKSIGLLFVGNGKVDGGAMFTTLVSDPVQSLFWQWFVLIFVGGIIMLGVSKGIEGTVKRLMPILFVLLIIIGVRSMTLPGASKGLEFLFTPDFSKIDFTVVLMAMGLAFFKLSIGMGTMTTYGSYYRDDQNVPLTTLRVMLADLTVSMLAGIAVFPAVFAFGFEPGAGPSLLFITIPSVFDSMPMGGVFQVLFFVLTAVAATGAMLSLLEVPVAFAIESMGWSRAKGTVVTVVLLGLFGAPAALSSSLTADVTFFGLNFFDLYDFLSSNVLMPAGGLCICLFAGWIWGKAAIRKAMSNHGALNTDAISSMFTMLVRFVTPVLILVVLLKGLKIF
ncbi:NSS family neurotransmitter:Na+ symporter [Desulfobaculum xiamenense]|uniref:Transporter n=1 Tax=Desulfobaculum xiamenense TaxID=995050 RepID=A0A846QDJ3_9BACT|nr:sodium-dependent transporter [Desulfobaculum xiamenense]NJB66796.1 NSS family neurotransmitter:Na+ symporter [Desulfobaculum xiamenense]